MSPPGEDSSSRGHLHQLLLPRGGTSTGAGVPAHPRAQLSLWSQRDPGTGAGRWLHHPTGSARPSAQLLWSWARGRAGDRGCRAARPPRGHASSPPDGARGADRDRSHCGASCAGVRYGSTKTVRIHRAACKGNNIFSLSLPQKDYHGFRTAFWIAFTFANLVRACQSHLSQC